MKTLAAATLLATLASATPLEARSCRSIIVRSGDSCATLAGECGISGGDFLKYNGGSGVCSRLRPGQKVCCTSGGLGRRAEEQAAAECKALRVVAGDSCGSLAGKCGISAADFTKYNGEEICSRLTIGEQVCCTDGAPPDTRPRPNPDGSCRTRTIKAGDSCYDYMTEYGITEKDLDEFNKDTPGWNGCARILPDEVICVSSGTPPKGNN